MIRLSFIVPFYNVEPYIEQCIRSLYDQDIPQEEYEVICIDDCSPDGSRAIVERLQKEYPTLRLICHTENKRQGGARNTGLDVAKGKYVWFVDSDDYIEANCLGRMLNNAEENDLDILRIYPVVEDRFCDDMIEFGVRSGADYIFDAPLKSNPINRCCSVVVGLVRTAMLRDNNIRFAEHRQYEDDDYAICMYAYANRLLSLPIAPYKIRQVVGSTTRRRIQLRTIVDWIEQVRRLIEIEPLIEARDRRWKQLIEDSIRWTCNGMILPNLKELSTKKIMLFYLYRYGKISNLKSYVGLRTYLALNSFVCWKILCR